MCTLVSARMRRCGAGMSITVSSRPRVPVSGSPATIRKANPPMRPLRGGAACSLSVRTSQMLNAIRMSRRSDSGALS